MIPTNQRLSILPRVIVIDLLERVERIMPKQGTHSFEGSCTAGNRPRRDRRSTLISMTRNYLLSLDDRCVHNERELCREIIGVYASCVAEYNELSVNPSKFDIDRTLADREKPGERLAKFAPHPIRSLHESAGHL